MAAYSNVLFAKGYNAVAPMTKHRFAVLTANSEEAAQAAASNVVVIGVNLFDVAALDVTHGRGCSIQMAGIAELEAGAAIARGALVMSDSSGRAITGATAGNYVVGIALEACSGVGTRVPVLLAIPGRVL